MTLKAFYRKNRLFLLYLLIGIISTGVEFTVFALLYRFMPYLWANVIGFHCGIVCSFILNRNFNFKKEDKTVIRFAAFYLVQLFCLALSSLILFILIDLAHLNPLLAKGISIILTATLPYFLNKRITFSNRF